MFEIASINPTGLPRNPAFSEAVSVIGADRTIYIGGQNGIGADGAVVADELAAQTTRALENARLVVAESGARLEDIVFWTFQIVAGQLLAAAFAAFQSVWGTRLARPPSPSPSCPRPRTRPSSST